MRPAAEDLPGGPEKPGAAQTTREAVLRAQRLFSAGENERAKLILADLLDAEHREREVYLLLAEIYRSEGLRQYAEDLTATAQNQPGLNAPQRRYGYRAPPVELPEPPVYWIVVSGGLLAAAVAVLGVGWVPEHTRNPWVAALPYLLAGGGGLLAGSALAASGLIRTFDQELSDPATLGGLLWLSLLLLGLFSAPLAVTLYVIVALLRGEAGLTLAVFLGSVAGLAALLSLGLGGGWQFWTLGLNLLWAGALIGWALGSVASPREWWRE